MHINSSLQVNNVDGLIAQDATTDCMQASGDYII